MSSLTEITFTGPHRVPRASQLQEAGGLKTLLGCLNMGKFIFFTSPVARRFHFLSNIFFICSVSLCGYLLTLENLEIYEIALQYCLSLYAVLTRKSDSRGTS